MQKCFNDFENIFPLFRSRNISIICTWYLIEPRLISPSSADGANADWQCSSVYFWFSFKFISAAYKMIYSFILIKYFIGAYFLRLRIWPHLKFFLPLWLFNFSSLELVISVPGNCFNNKFYKEVKDRNFWNKIHIFYI